MAVRNFWIDAEIDGRKTELCGGPRAKDGGMEITVYQRNKGQIEKGVRICSNKIGNDLVTVVFCNGAKVAEYITER